MINNEMDSNETQELRIKLRKAVVKSRLGNAVLKFQSQAELICSYHDFLETSRVTTAQEISTVAILAKSWRIVMVMFERILRV